MWYTVELEKYKKWNIGRYLLTFLLKEEKYGCFTTDVKKDNIFIENDFYRLSRDIKDSFACQWMDYLVPRTYSYILGLYHELGYRMEKSELFPDLELFYTTHGNRNFINGIFVKSTNGWHSFVDDHENGMLVNKLPPLYGTYFEKNGIFLHVKGFNDEIRDKLSENFKEFKKIRQQ